MPQARHTVTIRRAVDEVFSFVADGERCLQWRPGVLDIKKVSGNEGVGTRYEQGVKGPMGRRIAADYEITTFEPNKLIEFQTVTGPARPHGRYDLEAVPEGTKLTFSLDAEMSGLGGLIMRPMVTRTMESEVQTLDNLKRVMESSD